MRLLGIDLPDRKKVNISLTYLYGIGPSLAAKILADTKIKVDKKTKDLTQEELAKLKSFIESHFKIEGELRQEIKQNLARLKNIKTYRGLRHLKNLPVRGQRTRRNTRTVRGNVRKTVGSGRRKVELK